MVIDSDEYEDSASNLSGDEYVPATEELEEMEEPILPLSGATVIIKYVHPTSLWVTMAYSHQLKW